MTATAALLTVVASLLVHSPDVSVHCRHPVDLNSWANADGWTFYRPDGSTDIYIRDCQGVLEGDRYAADVLGHEILHAKHPRWTELGVARYEHLFGRFVLKTLSLVEE